MLKVTLCFFFFPSRYGLIMPKKLPQKNLVSKKLSVFADESDEEVSSTIFFWNLPRILQIYLCPALNGFISFWQCHYDMCHHFGFGCEIWSVFSLVHITWKWWFFVTFCQLFQKFSTGDNPFARVNYTLEKICWLSLVNGWEEKNQ